MIGQPQCILERRAVVSDNERYLFTASMDVDPEKEDLFNEVYDTEHVPLLSTVPGVISVQRLVSQPFQSPWVEN